MRITIDNLDGRGAQDYTEAVVSGGAIEVQRKLNTLSRCTAEVLIGAGGLAAPVRKARVVVTSDAGAVLFTGYLATEPVSVYAGQGSAGPTYVARLTAVSDEWLLDRQGSGATGGSGVSLGLDGGSLLTRLAARVQAGQTSAVAVETGGASLRAVGPFEAQPSKPWSTNAGAAASAAYASYRAVAGEVLVQPAGTMTHTLSDADGTLSVAELQTGAVRELANDVTLSGAEEPAAYVSEIFVGDGTATVFALGGSPFRSTQRKLLSDSFNEEAIDATQWSITDPGGGLSLTGAGLTLNGGTGQDGQTTLSALDAIEIGGSLVAQMGGVTFGAGSDGMIGGFYEGTTVLASCFAGFRVRQSASGSGGVTVLVPMVNGVEVGTVFTPAAGHAYTLRLRLHCVEAQRAMQRFYCMVDGQIQSFGGADGIAAPADVVFEVVDEGASSNAPATVLYDSAVSSGSLANAATCTFVAVNATHMFGAIGAISLEQTGSAWVVSTLPAGSRQTRLIGAAGEGVDCVVSYGTVAGAHGSVTFLAGRVPQANERVTVQYRLQQRSVARIADSASISAEAIGNSSGVSRWLGKVLQPIARSSADCESAAEAVLAFATSRSAAIAGKYACVNPSADIWPGDVLALTQNGASTFLLVRSVTALDGQSAPEVLRYEVAFANDWAAEWEDGLGLRLSQSIAADAVLPSTAVGSAAEVLANLQQLVVTSLTGTALQVDAGVAPPQGGGFEVRRRDAAFGASKDTADLVLRSPVQSFSIPRAAQVERFYVRVYDANTPPMYSRFSSAIFVNAPVG